MTYHYSDKGIQRYADDRGVYGQAYNFRPVMALRLKFGQPVAVVTVPAKPGRESGWERTHPDCMSRTAWELAVACGDIKRSPSGYYARIGRDWETFDPADYEYGY